MVSRRIPFLLLYLMVCSLSQGQGAPSASRAQAALGQAGSGAASDPNSKPAVIRFYRGRALTNHPASVFIDHDEVCSVHPNMFCVVSVEPGTYGFAQFPQFSPGAAPQNQVMVESGHEYYFSFKPNNVADWVCALLASSCTEIGWRMVPVERGAKEIVGLAQEEVVVPPLRSPRSDFLNLADFEAIALRLSNRAEVFFLYSYTNETDKDYDLRDGSSATLVEVEKWGGWRKSPDYRIEYPLIAPAHQRTLLVLSTTYDYSDSLRSAGEATPQRVAAFLNERTKSLYRFFVFDPGSGLKIDFYAGWKPKASEVFGSSSQFFANVTPERKACLMVVVSGGTLPSNQRPGTTMEPWRACFVNTSASSDRP